MKAFLLGRCITCDSKLYGPKPPEDVCRVIVDCQCGQRNIIEYKVKK